MKSVQVILNSIEKVTKFVQVVSKFDNKFELMADRYVVDAKSVIGVFSLNLANPICLMIYAEENIEQIMNALTGYII